jgi:hypothetical protein
MPNFDGGHYFFTALVPICNVGFVEHEELKSSPIHVVREELESLPTALQSHSTEQIGIQSPFARSLRTHFARLVVLDQPFFNGRIPADAIITAVRGTDLLAPQPVDELPCPYLLVMIDFDPVEGNEAREPRAYLEELWSLMPLELTAIFRYAYGFPSTLSACSFADFLIACRVETTMPFNDYWIGPPPLKSLPLWGLAAIPAAAVGLGVVLAILLSWPWWAGVLGAILLALTGLVIDYAWVMGHGHKPLPAAPEATLRHVLKALYIQQAFTAFASHVQGCESSSIARAFRGFLAEHRPHDLDAPTQPAGVIRSNVDGAA